jgi:hypothetical protein
MLKSAGSRVKMLSWSSSRLIAFLAVMTFGIATSLWAAESAQDEHEADHQQQDNQQNLTAERAEVRLMIANVLEEVNRPEVKQAEIEESYIATLRRLAENEVLPADLRKNVRQALEAALAEDASPFDKLLLRKALDWVYSGLADEEALLREYEVLVKEEGRPGGNQPPDDLDPKSSGITYNGVGGIQPVADGHWYIKVSQLKNIWSGFGSSTPIRFRIYFDATERDEPGRPEAVHVFLRSSDGTKTAPVPGYWNPTPKQDHFYEGPFFFVEMPSSEKLSDLTELVIVTIRADGNKHATAHAVRVITPVEWEKAKQRMRNRTERSENHD